MLPPRRVTGVLRKSSFVTVFLITEVSPGHHERMDQELCCHPSSHGGVHRVVSPRLGSPAASEWLLASRGAGS